MANLKSLTEIFSNTLYRIPDYQRGYAWTINQLKAFWDDLYNLSESKNHYTGVLTVKAIPSSSFNAESWNEERWLIRLGKLENELKENRKWTLYLTILIAVGTLVAAIYYGIEIYKDVHSFCHAHGRYWVWETIPKK